MSPEMEEKVIEWLKDISECWPEAASIAFQAEDLLDEILDEKRQLRLEN